MLRRSDASKHYSSAHKRFVKKAIEDFFKKEFPKLFGPSITSNIAESIYDICRDHFKEKDKLKTGQILWNAVAIDTRAGSYNVRFVPVVLTMVDDSDITNLENGMKITEHRQNVIARITKEAHEQGALLSMRDISLLMAADQSYVSQSRIQYEKKNDVVLPHTGTMHDMGSCLTHKNQIVYKYIVEKKDPLTVAKETNHTIKAVDNYIKNFNRVRTLFLDGKDERYINVVTNMSLNLIRQYIDIIKQFVPEPKYAS